MGNLLVVMRDILKVCMKAVEMVVMKDNLMAELLVG